MFSLGRGYGLQAWILEAERAEHCAGDPNQHLHPIVGESGAETCVYFQATWRAVTGKSRTIRNRFLSPV
jgi:hypothetical protein